jgi:hydrogenase nickel incorporation protein HypA/HybF
MHEMAVAESIVQIIQEKLGGLNPQAQVTKVNLKIGKLTCVEPEALRLSFQVLTRETRLEQAALCIDSVPVKAQCKDCHKHFGLTELDFACPFCSSFRVEILAGRELQIESFEIE